MIQMDVIIKDIGAITINLPQVPSPKDILKLPIRRRSEIKYLFFVVNRVEYSLKEHYLSGHGLEFNEVKIFVGAYNEAQN